jgi:hypothetical protein
MAEQLLVLNGPTIAAGESLSNAVDCSAGLPVRVTMPADWTPAGVSVQISSDGNFFNDCFDHTGHEIVMVVVPGTCVTIPEEWGRLMGFIKFRSGGRDNPVVQEAQRDFSIAMTTSNLPGGLPVIDSITPDTAVQSSSVTLVVTGSNFTANSRIQFAGVNKSTTFVNSNQLTATFTVGNVGSKTVIVRDDAAGDSNAVMFSVMEPT